MVFERKPSNDLSGISNEIVISTNENTRRIRVLEQSLESIRNRLSSLEERMIDDMGDIKRWMDQIVTDVGEISKEVKEIKGELLKVNKDLDRTAKKTEIKELENLLDIYNPIRSHFITRDELSRLLEEKMHK